MTHLRESPQLKVHSALLGIYDDLDSIQGMAAINIGVLSGDLLADLRRAQEFVLNAIEDLAPRLETPIARDSATNQNAT